MKSTCVHHPKSNRYIQVYEWQIAFCQQNHCAAFLLSHFIAWHDWKLNHDEYYSRANNIAELHGDGRPNNQNAYLFFTMEDLAEGILNLYGKNAINTALLLLEELHVISVHKNPNPRYHFDKTKYFMFYPEICNEWIKTTHEREENQKSSIEDLKEDIDRLKVSDRTSQSNAPSIEIKRPSLKKGGAITDTTSNTTSINKTTVVCLDDCQKEVQEILAALVNEGFTKQKLEFSESVTAIRELYKAGACTELFVRAYHEALSATGTNEFSVNYLVKAAENLMKTNQQSDNQFSQSCNFESDTSGSTTPDGSVNKKQQPICEGNYFSESKLPIRDDFYPDEQTIEKALSQGLSDVINPEKISQFIQYNQSNGSLWSDYNPIFIRWLMLDLKHNQKTLESLAQKSFRRSSDASYSNKPGNAKPTLADVLAANRNAVSPSGERLFFDDQTIEAEYGVALDSDVRDIRTDIY